MDAGTLIWILLFGGAVLAMFFMHRGGHAHGGHGGGGGCGGHGHDHDHGEASSEAGQKLPEADGKPAAVPDSRGHAHEGAAARGRHRGG